MSLRSAQTPPPTPLKSSSLRKNIIKTRTPPPSLHPQTHSWLPLHGSTQTPNEGSAVSPEDRISRSGAVMYCGVPVFAYKIIWASILPQTDLCHSEDSFTSPSLSLHWSLLNFSPTAPSPGDVIFSLNVQHLHWLSGMGRAMALL